METLSNLIFIVMLVFGVLQIILFFKLWRMTNDVHIIKNLVKPDPSDLMREVLKNNPNISSVLFDAIYDNMEEYYHLGDGNFQYILEKKYKYLYDMANLSIPDVFTSIKCKEDFLVAFKNKK